MIGGVMCLIEKDSVCYHCTYWYLKFLEQPKRGICHFRSQSTLQIYHKW